MTRYGLVIASVFALIAISFAWKLLPASESQATAVRGSAVKLYAFRLTPGQDLKKELLAFARKNQLKAPVIVTCVGSLTDVNLRYANCDSGTARSGHFEICSLVGMIDEAGGHIHMGVADRDGQMFGGHLLDGCKVYTTAEIAIAELTDLTMTREIDATFGYRELVVKPR